MAYTPINWQTGDTITAEKMNKMDNGWGVESTQLFSETVTTVTIQGPPAPVASLTYGLQLSASSLTVTFDNVEYVCSAIEMGDGVYYGEVGATGPVFTTYPFCIESAVNVGAGNSIYTETAGSHTVTAAGTSLQVSTNFGNAVNACIIPQVFVAESDITTWQEVHDAVSSGKIVCLIVNENGILHTRYVVRVETSNYHIITISASSGGDSTDLIHYYAASANSPIYPD